MARQLTERPWSPTGSSLRPTITPSSEVIVTTSWDDGHIYDFAIANLLEMYELPGTFYVAPKNCELQPRERLRDRDIIELSQRFEIGGHTLHHLRLPTLDDANAAKEISNGKDYLEDCIGRSLTSFCYPGGAYDPPHTNMVEQAGFGLARTIERHRIERPKLMMEVSTSFHAYQHLKDFRAALSMAEGNWKLAGHYYLNWDDWAIALFDRVRANGGVFHLWGHSWEIENLKAWDRLERVCAYISRCPGITYLDNGALAHLNEPSGNDDAA